MPRSEEFYAAAETVFSLAIIPGLAGGYAVFDVKLELQGWSEGLDGMSGGPHLQVEVPRPSHTKDRGADLMRRCRGELAKEIAYDVETLPTMIEVSKEQDRTDDRESREPFYAESLAAAEDHLGMTTSGYINMPEVS